MTKRYYWLKLKEDFFDEDTIEWLEEQENGKEYCLFYLKLCLKSLKTNGILIRNVGQMLIPYDVEKLGEMTRTPTDTVRVAMDLFNKLGLIQILENGEIYVTQLDNMVGSEASNSNAQRQKRFRERKKQLLLEGVTEGVTNSNGEIEKEIDIDIDKEKENKSKKKEPKHKYGEYQNVLLTDKEYKSLNSDYTNAHELIKFLDEYIEMKGYKAKSHYLAIKKWVVNAVQERKGGNYGTTKKPTGEEYADFI